MTGYLHISWLLVTGGWYWITLIALGLFLGREKRGAK